MHQSSKITLASKAYEVEDFAAAQEFYHGDSSDRWPASSAADRECGCGLPGVGLDAARPAHRHRAGARTADHSREARHKRGDGRLSADALSRSGDGLAGDAEGRVSSARITHSLKESPSLSACSCAAVSTWGRTCETMKGRVTVHQRHSSAMYDCSIQPTRPAMMPISNTYIMAWTRRSCRRCLLRSRSARRYTSSGLSPISRATTLASASSIPSPCSRRSAASTSTGVFVTDPSEATANRRAGGKHCRSGSAGSSR